MLLQLKMTSGLSGFIDSFIALENSSDQINKSEISWLLELYYHA